MNEPVYVSMRIDKDLVRVGDRFTHAGHHVQVCAVHEQPDRGGSVQYLSVAGVETGHLFRRPVRADRRIFDAPVQVLVSPDRLELFDLTFFGGGTGVSRGGRPIAQDGRPFDVPLTNGARCYLRPSFSPAGVSTSYGKVTAEPTFYKMSVAIPSIGVDGGLALLSDTSRRLWGPSQWHQMAERLELLALFDGGLSPAGQILRDVGAAGAHVNDEQAWFAAVETVYGPLEAGARTLVPHLARRWPGTLEQLLDAARSVSAEPAR